MNEILEQELEVLKFARDKLSEEISNISGYTDRELLEKIYKELLYFKLKTLI